MWRKICFEAIDSISGESLHFVSVCVIIGCKGYDLILPVLEIMVHNTGRKLKQIGMLFHSSVIPLPCVLSQCLSPSRYTNGYWVNFIVG